MFFYGFLSPQIGRFLMYVVDEPGKGLLEKRVDYYRYRKQPETQTMSFHDGRRFLYMPKVFLNRLTTKRLVYT